VRTKEASVIPGKNSTDAALLGSSVAGKKFGKDMDTDMRKLKTLMEKVGGIQGSNLRKGVAGFAAALSVFCLSAISCYAVEGKVTAETAKIRAQTSTDSEVVGSTQRGKTIDILEAVKDSAGSVWYKVSVSGGGYGYIRSDLVETSAAIEPTSQAGASGTGSSSSAPAETTPTSIGEQPATITSSKNANIRSGASTQHSTVATLPNGTGVTLIGEANDSSGNKWYQVRCTYNDKTVEGYVRSDLVTLGGDGAEAAEGENPEGTEGENPEGAEGENPEGAEGENPEGAEGGEGGEPTEPAPEEEHNDYEIVYAQNDTGEYEYYLYNNIDGTRQKLNELLSAISTANESNESLQDQVDKGKIIIIILAGVIIILFIVLTVLLFKIRELYYGDDYEEEEEEEEEEPEPEPVKKKRRKRPQEEEEEEEEEEEPPVRKKKPRPQGTGERPAKSQERAGQSRTKGDRELHALENKEPAKKQPARKPQNFLVDDDEFEFEFLNMDDKDL